MMEEKENRSFLHLKLCKIRPYLSGKGSTQQDQCEPSVLHMSTYYTLTT